MPLAEEQEEGSHHLLNSSLTTRRISNSSHTLSHRTNSPPLATLKFRTPRSEVVVVAVVTPVPGPTITSSRTGGILVELEVVTIKDQDPVGSSAVEDRRVQAGTNKDRVGTVEGMMAVRREGLFSLHLMVVLTGMVLDRIMISLLRPGRLNGAVISKEGTKEGMVMADINRVVETTIECARRSVNMLFSLVVSVEHP